MNNQELLDEAIHLKGGKWNTSFEYLVYSNGRFIHKDVNGLSSYGSEPRWFHMAYRARAKELGYVNGYPRGIDQAIDALGGAFPTATTPKVAGGYFMSGDVLMVDVFLGSSRICTKAEFESRKAERQGKPDWRGAPHWANWLSQDSDGIWCWYEPKPEVGDTAFKYPCQSLRFEMVHSVRKGEVFGNWQDTLEQRPEVAKGANPHKKITKEDLAKAGYIFCSDFLGHVKAKSAHSEPEKAVEEVLQAEAERMRSFLLTIASDKALFSKIAKPEPAKADWYDYERRQAIKLPPVGIVCEWSGNGGRHWHKTALIFSDETVFLTRGYQLYKTADDSIKFRPLDWSRSQPKVEPEQSPELSFHLATAQNELQASAKLLPAESNLLQSITGVIAAIQAIREVV